MSNYTKSTNFATKDNLTPGDPLKVVRGTEIDTEFNNIATAVATKTDNSAAAITGGTIDGATVGATTPATGSFTTLAASGTTTLAGALVGAVTQAAFNTVSTTLNLGGAATAVNLGAATGTATVNNTTLAAKAITASTTLAVTGTSTLTGAVTATAGVTGPITSSSVSITGGSITGITDLAVADGGTGASTAAGGLNNLLPSQTGNSSKYLQTDGTNASWDAVSLSTADITGTLGAANGGTGVSNNAAMTVTGSGNFAYTRTLTGTTNVTFPTTGTLATLAGTETLTNKTLTSPTLTTPTLGVATGTSFQGIIGNVTPAAGAFTTVTASTAIGTTSGGTGLTSFTSGGVVYASSTSALATGSAFTFDGSTVKHTQTAGAAYFSSQNTATSSGAMLLGANAGGDLNIYNPNSTAAIFYTSATERMRISSAGDVGIGTTSPAAKLNLGGSSDQTIQVNGASTAAFLGVSTTVSQISSNRNPVTGTIYNTGAAVSYINLQAANLDGNIQFYTTATNNVNATERMRITAAGNVGIGTASPTNKLDVSGTMGVTGVATFSAGTAALPALTTTGDTNTGIFFPAADTIAFSEGGAEAARIDSSGNLLVGTSSAAQKLTVSGGIASITGISGLTASTTFFDHNSGNGRFAAVSATTGTAAPITLSQYSSNGSVGRDTLSIDTNGGVRVFNTLGVGNITPTTSGAGITFPATQSASTDANTLDDYEEGTWTPTIGGTATYNVQEGRYVKVGTLVYLQCKIEINVLGTGSTTTLSGLPFTSLSTSFNSGGTGAINYFASLASVVTTLVAGVSANSTNIFFGSLTAAGTTMTAATAVFGNSARIDFAVTYRAAS